MRMACDPAEEIWEGKLCEAETNILEPFGTRTAGLGDSSSLYTFHGCPESCVATFYSGSGNAHLIKAVSREMCWRGEPGAPRGAGACQDLFYPTDSIYAKQGPGNADLAPNHSCNIAYFGVRQRTDYQVDGMDACTCISELHLSLRSPSMTSCY